MERAIRHPDRNILAFSKRLRLKPKTDVIPDLGRCEIEAPLTSRTVRKRSYGLGLTIAKPTDPGAPRRLAPGIRIDASGFIKRNDQIVADGFGSLRMIRFTRELEMDMEIAGHRAGQSLPTPRCETASPINAAADAIRAAVA